MRNVHTTLLWAFQRYQKHNKKELSLKSPCLCALVWPCVSSSILKRSCRVSRMQRSEGTGKQNPKLRANLLWRPIYTRKPVWSSLFFLSTLVILTLCFCHQFQQNWGPVPLSWVILRISLIYTVLIHLCNPKKFEEAKVLNFATFTWVTRMVYDI
jgi:cytochrome c oxidase subunit IV